MNKKVGLSFRDFENAENKGFSREGRPTFSAQTIEKERLKCIIENRKLIKSVVVPYLKGIETKSYLNLHQVHNSSYPTYKELKLNLVLQNTNLICTVLSYPTYKELKRSQDGVVTYRDLSYPTYKELKPIGVFEFVNFHILTVVPYL